MLKSKCWNCGLDIRGPGLCRCGAIIRRRPYRPLAVLAVCVSIIVTLFTLAGKNDPPEYRLPTPKLEVARAEATIPAQAHR
jgi:hypothetical protein